MREWERKREREKIEINEINSKGESKRRVINTWFNITRLPLVSSHHHRTPFDFCLHSIPPHCTRPTRCVHTRPGIYTTSSSPPALVFIPSLHPSTYPIPLDLFPLSPSFVAVYFPFLFFFLFPLCTSCILPFFFFFHFFLSPSLFFSQRVKERGPRVVLRSVVLLFPFRFDPATRWFSVYFPLIHLHLIYPGCRAPLSEGWRLDYRGRDRWKVTREANTTSDDVILNFTSE